MGGWAGVSRLSPNVVLEALCCFVNSSFKIASLFAVLFAMRQIVMTAEHGDQKRDRPLILF